jgi:hypothetical protein
VAVNKASRAGLAPAQRAAPPPVDPRLKPWYDRCKSDHDRLATIQGQHVTVYQARLAYDQTRALLTQYRALAIEYAALHAAVVELRTALKDTDIQLALPLPELRKLPEPPAEPVPTKRGSKPAAAR